MTDLEKLLTEKVKRLEADNELLKGILYGGSGHWATYAMHTKNILHSEWDKNLNISPRNSWSDPPVKSCENCKDWGRTITPSPSIQTIQCGICKRHTWPNLGVNCPAGSAWAFSSSNAVQHLLAAQMFEQVRLESFRKGAHPYLEGWDEGTPDTPHIMEAES